MKTETLQALYRVLKNSAVDTCELTRGDTSVRMTLDRRAEQARPTPTPATAPPPSAAATPAPPELLAIRSDTVGLFHTHHGAFDKPLARPGDTVRKGQTVGLIVSMGVTHELVSPHDGRIVTQRVQHREPVEYGEVIFELEKE